MVSAISNTVQISQKLEELSKNEKGSVETSSITSLIDGFSSTDHRVRFCFLILKRTLDSLVNHKYSDFDAQTTSNCCHGIAILVRDLIAKIQNMNLFALREEVEANYKSYDEKPNQKGVDYQVPKALISLSQLYVLTYIRDIDPVKGVRTFPNKLTGIVKMNTQFYGEFVKNLQKKYSNIVAFKYKDYANEVDGAMKISNISVDLWKKYVSAPYLKSDFRNIHYAPCLFSMQVSLAYLCFKNAKIAVLNDIFSESGEFQRRYVKILEGDENGILHSLNLDEYKGSSSDPVVVYGGCSYSSNPDLVALEMDKWLPKFSHLVLGCDVHYPQFPQVRNDPKFNSNSIVPDEKDLQDVINEHGKIDGVSAKAPSLFCLNHIYPTSTAQILDVHFQKNQDALPVYKIPTILHSPQVQASK